MGLPFRGSPFLIIKPIYVHEGRRIRDPQSSEKSLLSMEYKSFNIYHSTVSHQKKFMSYFKWTAWGTTVAQSQQRLKRQHGVSACLPSIHQGGMTSSALHRSYIRHTLEYNRQAKYNSDTPIAVQSNNSNDHPNQSTLRTSINPSGTILYHPITHLHPVS